MGSNVLFSDNLSDIFVASAGLRHVIRIPGAVNFIADKLDLLAGIHVGIPSCVRQDRSTLLYTTTCVSLIPRYTPEVVAQILSIVAHFHKHHMLLVPGTKIRKSPHTIRNMFGIDLATGLVQIINLSRMCWEFNETSRRLEYTFFQEALTSHIYYRPRLSSISEESVDPDS